MSEQASQEQWQPSRYRGQVTYIYAYDVAYDMRRQPIATLLGTPLEQFSTGLGKRHPRQPFFFQPQMLRLPTRTCQGPQGPVQVETTVKLFPVGAVSIAVSIPFAVHQVEDLVAFHDLQLDGAELHTQVKELAERLRKELEPFSINPVAELKDEEAYTVFCITSPLESAQGAPLRAEDWMIVHRRQVAALLTQEQDATDLSDQEADETTGLYLSYYEHDLSVIDWDAALLIDKPDGLAQSLHIMELANVQLAELEEYDRVLDEAVEKSYRDFRKPGRVRFGSDVLRNLREIRVDMARLSDELSNITKFFGDWHLARMYQNLSHRFHLRDWQNVIEEKQKTLDDLYKIVKQEQLNWWMMVLEITIVLLFIIDLVILVKA